MITKKTVISKIHDLLEKTKKELELHLAHAQLPDRIMSGFRPMKISRGENYRDLPYMVLDYPARFSKKDIFAYRTMFWWGNFFSCTLHLQGKSLLTYRSKILLNIDQLEKHAYYLCISDSPWQYHYGADNYKQLTISDSNFIETSRFLKLSKKIKLDEWASLPEFSVSCLSNFLKILELI